jgi:release factor glutamine methyltransferase
MLPTPSTSHVPYERVYEPAEDSFLLLDMLSSPSETAFLSQRFPTTPSPTPSPLILEIGPGSGVVLAFITAHAQTLFSRRDVLTLGIDINRFACAATAQTVAKAVAEAEAEVKAEGASVTTTDPSSTGGGSDSERSSGAGYFLSTAQGDLTSAVRPGQVDVLVFNPPYVPTAELPSLPNQLRGEEDNDQITGEKERKTTYEEDSALLALSYAGGKDGMEITDRVIAALPRVLSARGVAYLLLCAQNKPEEVKGRIREMEGGGVWRAETVGSSGRQAGWEKLQIVRIWRK